MPKIILVFFVMIYINFCISAFECSFINKAMCKGKCLTGKSDCLKTPLVDNYNCICR